MGYIITILWALSLLDLYSNEVHENGYNICSPSASGLVKQSNASESFSIGEEEPSFAIINEILKQAEKALSNTLNTFCCGPKRTSEIIPDVKKIFFQFRTTWNIFSIPVSHVDKLIRIPLFDPKKKVVIIILGWLTGVDDEITTALENPYHCRNDTNFIVVNNGGFLNSLYHWAVMNTDQIGKHIAEGLTKISEAVPVENIHLIGHSLGAHVAGVAGRYFTYITGKVIPRITGLDPAKPCFRKDTQLSGLSRGDAEFIDVIHSSSGILGIREPVGDVDFYPGGLYPLQPGCWSLICSHERAWKYYAETVYPNQERNFMSRRCDSLTNIRKGKCPGENFPMGYAVPNNLKGSFFLEVNSESPFGLNATAVINEKCA